MYDRLVDARLLRRARPDADLVDAGKTPGGGGSRQRDINARLVSNAAGGKSVVRLKGGDPFVFGRGGEEAGALSEAGVTFEVVPGVTSAIAAPAYAGIPVTHRGLASSATFVTGSESPDKPGSPVDWSALARTRGSVVVMMGWRALRSVIDRLAAEGMPADTPAALVEWGTTPRQRTVVGTLSDVLDRASAEGLGPPVTAIFGQVARLRERLRWFDDRPLFGRRVLVTRSSAQSWELTALLEREGAEVVEVPSIRIEPPDDFGPLDSALDRLDSFHWVVFTSANAVNAMFDRLSGAGRDARALRASRVAAIGRGTARALRESGIAADLVVSKSVSEGLVDEMGRLGVSGLRILLPGAQTRRAALSAGLERLGAEVETVPSYRTVHVEGSQARLPQVLSDGIDVVTFTSASTVRGFIALLDDVGRLAGVEAACIGPITAREASNAGLDVAILAGESTLEGLVEAMRDYYGNRSVAG